MKIFSLREIFYREAVMKNVMYAWGSLFLFIKYQVVGLQRY